MKRATWFFMGALCLSGAQAATYQQGQLYYQRGQLEQAYREWMLAAWEGDRSAIFALGEMNTYNEGTAKNYAEALALYSDPENANNVRALTGLGVLYKFGLGVPRDFKKSLAFTRKAADLGDPVATYNLGLNYSDMGQYAQAITAYQKAEKSGIIQATHNLGYVYEQQGQNELAAQTYLRAARQGFPASQINLGRLYLDGRGVKRDAAEAMRLFKAAADQGVPKGHIQLADMYMRGNGVPVNYEEAARYFSWPAELGDLDSQSNLGWVFMKLGKNDLAMKWSRVAADRGDGYAQSHIGLLYEYGRGVPVSPEQAEKWYRLSAGQQNREGTRLLGKLLFSQKRYAEALKWNLQAGASGDKGAQSRVGYQFEYGLGTAKSIPEAIRWYSLAAAQGDDYSIKHLAALKGK